MPSYDDFTLYIFQEDLTRLETFPLGSEGSLYGLWTSTLNPVVHVVHERRSSTQSSDSIHDRLAQRYKMAYLGNWRVVGQSGAESISPPHSFQPGSTGFLAVTVKNGKVIPHMYERPTDIHPKRGSVDALQGDNPFAKDQDTRAIISGTTRAGQQWQERAVPTGSEAYETYYRNQQLRQRYGDTNPRPNQRRVAAAREPAQTSSLQWYSSEGGEQSLKRVFERMKGIADGREVQMVRNSQTQDITLSFKCRRRDWSIEFPASFPVVGAKIRGNGTRFASLVEKQTSGTSFIHTAIGEICAIVQQT